MTLTSIDPIFIAPLKMFPLTGSFPSPNLAAVTGPLAVMVGETEVRGGAVPGVGEEGSSSSSEAEERDAWEGDLQESYQGGLFNYLHSSVFIYNFLKISFSIKIVMEFGLIHSWFGRVLHFIE